MRDFICRTAPALAAFALFTTTSLAQPIRVDDRRELFVDRFLIEELNGARIEMHKPEYAPPFKKPIPLQAPRHMWQGFGGYFGYMSMFQDGDSYRMYGREYRFGVLPNTAPAEKRYGNEIELYAESKNGIDWDLPNLGIYDNIPDIKEGNVTLAFEGDGVMENFTPFLDTRPGVPAEQRYKAVGGSYKGGGLRAYVSADGLHWKRMQKEAIIPPKWAGRIGFDSQNLAFWSELERCYICYFRTFDNQHSMNVRSVRRSTSADFIHWTEPVDIQINRLRPEGYDYYRHQYEELYVPNIKPYFRAPHIYIALPTLMDTDKRAATEVLLTASRDGIHFDRSTFTEPFLRPGIAIRGRNNYGNRGTYAGHQVVQTGPVEMSLYTYDGRRFIVRLDGFSSLNAPFAGGEMITKPLIFKGGRLEINARTAGIGFVKVEIQDEAGEPIPGFTLDDAVAFVGDDVAHIVVWNGGNDVSKLAGCPIRLRFVMKDADVYSLKFNP